MGADQTYGVIFSLQNGDQSRERGGSVYINSVSRSISGATAVRLKLPLQLRRSLACTNIIENMMGSIRRVCRNVKRWRDAPMALRWTGAAMQEAAKGFRR